MKRAVMTALAVTLLSGTSAQAQGLLGRVVREAQNSQAQAERTAPPQRESRPQQQAAPATPPPARAPAAAPSQSRGDSGGDQARRSRDGGGALAGAVQAQRQRQGGAQGQRRPDAQPTPGQARPGGQYNSGQGRPQGQQGQGQRRPGGQQGQTRPDRDDSNVRNRRSDGGPLANTVREAARRQGYDADQRQRYEDNRSRWNDNDRDYNRRPIIRPEDRRDRDRNRPRYDQRRYPHYVTPYQRYRWIGPSYRLPPGFYSFRWQWGQTLPWNWYTPNYYLDDYWRYGLPMPPVGFEWVRVGDDAILVDVFTGRIYQVVYNLFW